VLQIVDAKIRFIFGLGITQVVDAIGKGAGQNGMFITIAVDGVFLLMLILCWKWAKAGSQGAFLAGMIAYALDGVLLLYFSMWLDAGVHAYALYMMWQGYAAARELVEARGDLPGHGPFVDVMIPVAQLGERHLETDVGFRQPRDFREGLAERNAHEERPDEPGPLRDRHGTDVVDADRRLIEGGLVNAADVAHMLA